MRYFQKISNSVILYNFLQSLFADLMPVACSTCTPSRTRSLISSNATTFSHRASTRPSSCRRQRRKFRSFCSATGRKFYSNMSVWPRWPSVESWWPWLCLSPDSVSAAADVPVNAAPPTSSTTRKGTRARDSSSGSSSLSLSSPPCLALLAHLWRTRWELYTIYWLSWGNLSCFLLKCWFFSLYL